MVLSSSSINTLCATVCSLPIVGSPFIVQAFAFSADRKVYPCIAPGFILEAHWQWSHYLLLLPDFNTPLPFSRWRSGMSLANSNYVIDSSHFRLWHSRRPRHSSLSHWLHLHPPRKPHPFAIVRTITLPALHKPLARLVPPLQHFHFRPRTRPPVCNHLRLLDTSCANA